MESTILKLAEERDREKYLSEITAIHSREKIQLCQEIILDSFGVVAAVSAAMSQTKSLKMLICSALFDFLLDRLASRFCLAAERETESERD